MPFKNLKQHIIHQVTSGKQGKAFDFSNTFSEVLNRKIKHEEAIVLLTAMAPHIQPGFFEEIIQILHPDGGEFPQWGGVKHTNYRGFLPTGETVQYILAGKNINKRGLVQKYFSEDHWFFSTQTVLLENVQEGVPKMSGQLIMPAETIDLLLFGEVSLPAFGSQFPAELVATKMAWVDLVLSKETFEQIHQIRLWLKHEKKLRHEYGLDKRLSPGYRALFHGSSGTGKTLTASLLGKEFNMPVYRIDLSQIVSKYIGETEKNLERIFTRAENKNWILFFDEADALFGKRTATKDSHDRYANQGVSYLLQRTENFNGLILLASNFKENIDEAFIRRLNQIIEFPKPEFEDRLALWQKTIPKQLKAKTEILEKIAKEYELTGAQIVNAVSFVCLHFLEHKSKKVEHIQFMEAIKREFKKEERMFTQLP
ncbi:ATP-binding protein [Subsaximicrobium wynnwilliamsii]|uniref:ATP-binding protein n=1 Tax=Subsaximicrobium wynnwilliamsii TaxID=291179 RepID=A0A5C6ZQA5_9FLAO|nr:ATP-binding protein [Subsaximicrobium wynnwilliamsii]TXD85060.1 ATP-binding protein [Subsaximicrobium wynnwilliamsii]TXD91103.1 ATP-binding protein [Subsaximicrobium wynnwilliamsii]TXE04497.1 ATP-binding protein [Subsaximicrobium wynnwilliamsii]